MRSKVNQLYAAYGSNMNLEQMAHRCPYATVQGSAILHDYRLVFRGHSGSAVATVEPAEGCSVPILIWEITPRCEEALDRYEGWPTFYRQEEIVVEYTGHIAKHRGKFVYVVAYIMNDGYPLGSPSERYLNSIVEGYRSAGFDTAVLDEAVRVSEGG